MAFQTGTSTGPADLISKLATFAAANGWTISPASGGGSVFINAARGLYFGVAWNTTDIYIEGATGYSGAATWNTQPGYSTDTFSQSQVNDCAGPHKLYYFFGTEQYLHVVIETVTNKFKHFVIGQLEKNSIYTGGAYFDGSYHNTSTSVANFPDDNNHRYLFDTIGNTSTGGTGRIRVDIDGKTNNWMGYGSSGASSTESNMVKGCTRAQYSLTASLHYASPNSFNQRTVLTPILIAAARGSALFSLIGAPKDMRLVNMRNFNPGEILTIGSDDWYVFPHIQKSLVFNTNGSALQTSGLYGYAYKRVD